MVPAKAKVEMSDGMNADMSVKYSWSSNWNMLYRGLRRMGEGRNSGKKIIADLSVKKGGGLEE